MKHFISNPKALVTYYCENCANGQLDQTHGRAACLIHRLYGRILQFGQEFECGYILPSGGEDGSWCDMAVLRSQITSLPASGRSSLEMWGLRHELNEVVDRELASARAASAGEERVLAQYGRRIGGYMLGYGVD